MLKAKRMLSIVLALLMCVSMLTGIILPASATTAQSVNDAYAGADEYATELTVESDGTIILDDGTPVTVPDEFIGEEIYATGPHLWLYNPNWRNAGNAGVTNVGDYFIVRYGDGTTWGNGKIYLAQWGVTAFGGSYADANSDPMHFAVMQDKLAANTPTVGGDNNYYVLCFPGFFHGATSKTDHILPSDDPAQSDINNIYYLGPQAGRTPVNADATQGVANGRGLSTDTEFAFRSDFNIPKNSFMHLDGFAMSEWIRIVTPAWVGPPAWYTVGLTLDNMYIHQNQTYGSQNLFDFGFYELWGSTVYTGHNNVAAVFHMTDSYITETVTSASTAPWEIEANDLVIDGCVFDNIGIDASSEGNFGGLALAAGNKIAGAKQVLGDKAGKWTVNVTNNTFLNYHPYTAVRIAGPDLFDYDANATVNVNKNKFLNFGTSVGTSIVLSVDDDTGANKLANKTHNASVSFCDNYIQINPDVTATKNLYIVNTNYMDAQSSYKIRGNTVIGGRNGTGNYYDFCGVNAANDISGNLFLDHNNNVRVPLVNVVTNDYVNSYKVLSDIYASDEMAGGLKELFTITESPEDLFVAHSQVQTTAQYNDTASLGYIRGTITVYPENGVTYETENLFAFSNEEVDLIGVYGSEADAVAGQNALTELEKGFGTAYVKAEYKAGTTTATVIYTVVEPTKFHVVHPSATTYTFNGDTFSDADENTNFYTTIQAAIEADDQYTRPHTGTGSPTEMTALDCVVIVAPGTYGEDMTMTRATAIIGPGFGKKASTDGAATVANGRGIDDTTEAVYTGMVTLSLHEKVNDLYVAVSGMAFNGQDRIFVYDYSGIVQADHKKEQRFAYLNLTDIYAAPKSGLLFQGGYKEGVLQWVEHADDSTLLNVNIDNSYLTNFTGSTSSYYIYGQMGGLNITDTTANLDGAPACPLYKMTPCGKNFVVKPLRDYLRIENCYWKASASNYLMNYGPFGGSIKDTYGKGSLATIVNNTFETDSILYRAVPVGVETQNLIFTGNTVKRSTNSATTIFDYSIKYGATEADMEFNTVDISENIIINSTTPWNLTASNNVNVDENYYGTSEGKVQKISGGSGYTKSDWYYMDHELEVKNTDLMPQDNGYDVYKMDKFDNGMNYLTIETETNPAKTDIVAPTGVTVEGIYSDAECTNEITKVNGDTTVYIKMSKVNSAGKTVVCVNAVTFSTPCLHQGQRVAAGRVEPTCGTPGSQKYACNDCSQVVPEWTETLPATDNHIWDDGVVSVEPTCETMGTTLYTCTNTDCKADGSKATKTEQDIAIVDCESDGTWHETLAPGCETKGTEVQKCKWCEEVLATRDVDPINHDWDDGVEDPVHNCLNDGLMTYTCQNDSSHTYTEVVESTGEHNFVGVVKVPATCTTEGTITYTCNGCGASHDEAIPVTGHNYVAETTKEPTCVEDGILTYTCQNVNNGVACGDTYTTPAPANGSHDYKAEVTKEANCTEDGVMTYTCQRESCGFVTTEPIPNKGGHQWSDWTTRTPSTCVIQGEEYRICSVCEEEEARALLLIDHYYDSEFTVDIQPTGTVRGEKSRHCKMCKVARTDITDMGYCPHENTDGQWHIERETACDLEGEKYQICTDCGDKCNITAIEKLPHQMQETAIITPVSCTEDGVRELTCQVCGSPEQEAIVAPGHNPGVWKTTTKPTCTDEGEKTQSCTVCQEVLSTVAVAAKGHGDYEWITVIEPSCTNDGYAEYTCVDCGDVADSKTIAAKGHQDVHVDTIPATCTEEGERIYVCAICNEPLTVDIPATGHTAGKWEVVKQATSLGIGLKVKKCVDCGEVVEEEAIEQIVASGNPFTDVPDNAWYGKAVDFVYNSGLMNGTGATTFSPNLSTTRGMFVTILGRLSGVNASKYTNAYFEDVKDGSYYFGYIEWARVNKIVEGTGNFVFEPDRAITRQEMCKMIVSYADYEEITIANKVAKKTFTDDAKIAKWAKAYVYQCQRGAIVSGDTTGTFRPTDTASRAEIATLIMNFYLGYIK